MKLQSAFATRLVWLAALLLALLAVASFSPSPTSAQSASLTATVHGDKSVDLAISNHQGNWWFKINWWGSCTAVTGNSINGIQGYKLGTHSVWAYSDSDCASQIAATTFTISAASLTATVNSDRSVDLTLSNGPSPWYFRVGWGSCTAVSGTTVSGIRGYAPGSYGVGAFSKSDCTDFLAAADFTIPDPPPPTATLATTVNTGPSVNLTLTNGPSNWWFRINWWGTCTAASGNTVNNIRGYQAGAHSVDAYSDSGCHTTIASSSFTIPQLALAAAVNNDRSVDLTLTGGPTNWWFKIGWWGTCTAATGTTASNIRGYQSGSYVVAVYPASGCAAGTHIAAESFTIPNATLTATVNSDRSVDLNLSNGPNNWWFRINWWGTCTAAPGTTVSNIQGYQPGTHAVAAYSDSVCNYHVASSSFTLTGQPAQPAAPKLTSGNRQLTAAWTAPSSGASAINDYDLRYRAVGTTNWNSATDYTTYFANKLSNGSAGWAIDLGDVSIAGLTITKIDQGANNIRFVYEIDEAVDRLRVALSGNNGQGSARTYYARYASTPPTTANMATHGTLLWQQTNVAYSADFSGSDWTPALPAGTYFWVAATGGNTSTAQVRPTIQADVIAVPSPLEAVLKGLTNGTTYEVQVRAANQYGPGPWSPSSMMKAGLTLTASAVTATGATLTIGAHTAQWWYQADTGPHATCQGPVAANTSTKNLTGLKPGTTYTYKAYSATGCPSANLLAAADAFTTPAALTASNVTATGATLTIAGHTGQWWYQAETGPHATCQGPVAADTSTKALTGLTPGTTYTYKAYSATGCASANEIAAAASFTAIGLSASNVTTTTATLTLDGAPSTWYLKRSSPADPACTTKTTNTHSLSTLTAGTWYAYKAYSATGCASANEIASATFSTAVTVSNHDAQTSVFSIGSESGTLKRAGQAFTTGSNTGGYTLSSIAGSFSLGVLSGVNPSIEVKLYRVSGNYPGTEITTATFSGSNPATTGSHIYDCSGSGCELTGETTYIVTFSAPTATGSNRYLWRATTSDSETLTPSGNGWFIGNTAVLKDGNGPWYVYPSNPTHAAQIKVTALPQPSLDASSIGGTTATLTLTGETGSWWLKQTAPNTGMCTAGESDYSHALSSLTTSTSYTFKAYSESSCATTALHSVTFTTLAPPSLTAGDITPTTATLTLANRAGSWWVKETAPSNGTCSSEITGTTHDLTGLTGGAVTTYKAYSATGCNSADEMASETFITPVSLSNLNTSGTGTTVVDSTGGEAASFTTGGNAGGYTLESVDVRISSVTNTTGNTSGDLTVAIYTSSGNSPSTSQATLTGSNPTGAGTYTFTCPSSANCSLSPATRYHVVLTAPNTTGQGKYVWETASSNAAEQEPPGNGWSVQQSRYQLSGSWYNAGDPRKTRLTAAVEPSLTASSITSTGATIALSHHPDEWWYKGSQANASCTPVAKGTTTATLSSLTSGTSYTYKAYAATGCNSADEIAAASAFTAGSAPTLTAGTPTASKNTLTIANWNGVWSYKHGNTGAVCTPVAAGTTSVNLTGLAGNTSYTFTAYSDSTCSAAIDAAPAFSTATVTLTAAYTGPVGERHAVLTLAGWIAGDHRDSDKDGRWYYKYTVPTGGTCSYPRNTQTGLDIDVTVGTSYTFKAYSDACSTEIATLTQIALGPGVANSDKDFTDLDSQNTDTDGVWTNGTTMWALDSTDDKIYAYTLATKARDSAKDFASLHVVGAEKPYGIWSDGTTMWVATGTDLYAYKMSDKSRDSAKDIDLFASSSGNHQPFGIWSDGTTMWVADYIDNKLYAYKLSDGSHDSAKDITLHSDNANANGIWSDGTTMWVVDHSDNKVYAYKMSDKSRDSVRDFSVAASPRGITSDGHYFWVANSSTDDLHAHYAFPALTATSLTFTAATLTLTGYDADWWLKKTSSPAGSCTAGESDYSHAISSLSPSTSYTYKAYSDSQCQSQNELASETFTTAALSGPGSVGAQVQDISMTTTANNQLQVWWDRPSNTTGSIGYTVECYTNVYKVCHTEAAGTGTSFKVTPSSTGVPTKVRVRSTLSGSNSGWVEVNVPSGTAPGAPTNVTSTLISGGYRMQWSKPSSPSGAVGYHTQCRDSNTNWTNCGSAGSNGVISPTASATVTTNVGYIFQFRVRSVVNGLVSAWLVSS